MPSNETDNIYSSEYRDSGQPIPATIIGYDNTSSGLEATNAQAAIDELAGEIVNLDAAGIAYDNTISGMTADTAQEAIDELAEGLGTLAGTVAEIIEMPALPADSADGTYVLKATASSGTITYAWVVEV